MFARFRRKRIHPVLRDLLEETHLSVNDFMYPLFARSGEGIKDEVASMPGVYQMSIDEIVKECDVLKGLGISVEEEAQGIDQVNVAISQMEKVVQQTAANAEESASAAEELSAQAEQLRSLVDELTKLVGGNNKNETTLSKETGKSPSPHIPETTEAGNEKTPPHQPKEPASTLSEF